MLPVCMQRLLLTQLVTGHHVKHRNRGQFAALPGNFATFGCSSPNDAVLQRTYYLTSREGFPAESIYVPEGS